MIKTVKQLQDELGKELYDVKHADVLIRHLGLPESYEINEVTYDKETNQVIVEVTRHITPEEIAEEEET